MQVVGWLKSPEYDNRLSPVIPGRVWVIFLIKIGEVIVFGLLLRFGNWVILGMEVTKIWIIHNIGLLRPDRSQCILRD